MPPWLSMSDYVVEHAWLWLSMRDSMWLSYICDYGVEYMNDSIRLSMRDSIWFSICVTLCG